nr:hypothetical protein [Tanacetum cinerariifolium]
VGPASERGHLRVGQVIGGTDHGQRIALGGGAGKHVDLLEFERVGHGVISWDDGGIGHSRDAVRGCTETDDGG